MDTVQKGIQTDAEIVVFTQLRKSLNRVRQLYDGWLKQSADVLQILTSYSRLWHEYCDAFQVDIRNTPLIMYQDIDNLTKSKIRSELAEKLTAVYSYLCKLKEIEQLTVKEWLTTLAIYKSHQNQLRIDEVCIGQTDCCSLAEQLTLLDNFTRQLHTIYAGRLYYVECLQDEDNADTIDSVLSVWNNTQDIDSVIQSIDSICYLAAVD